MAWLGPFLLFLIHTSTFIAVECYPFEEYGVITPRDTYLWFVGTPLVLLCNITNKDLREDSSMLYFERETKKESGNVSQEYIKILTTKAIRLHLPKLDIDDDGGYTCLQRTISGDLRTISYKRVYVDYKPQKIKDISCRVYNWEQMNCTWDLGVKFQHLEYINVSLAWTIHGEQQDCPNGSKTSCFWNKEKYYHGHQYVIVIEVRTIVEGKELMFEQSPQFRVETFLYVEPAPVDNFQASVVNSSCVNLNWTHSAENNQKFFVAQSRILGRYKWNEIILNQDRKLKKKFQSPVCGLIPFTDYEFRMSALPYPIETKEPVIQGYRSEWRMVATKTFEDVPGAAPKICSGCFHEKKCSNNESLHCVQIYWQDLAENEKHGILNSYNITISKIETGLSNSLLKPVIESRPLTSVNLKLPSTNQDFEISICPSTSKGFSRSYSSLFLPSAKRKPNAPSSFLVETDNKANEGKDVVFFLSWAPLNVDDKTRLKYTNITIVWCYGNRDDAECKGDIQWVQLPADQVTYELNTGADEHENSAVLIGITAEVSSQGRTVSSGINWSTCTYVRNQPPQNPPKNVHESHKHPANGLTILWEKFECSLEKSFITQYVVRYCVSYDDQICMEKSQTISNTASGVTLEDLKEDARYKVTVIAVSSAGLGPSQPILTKAVKSSPPDYAAKETVAITVAISVCLLALITLVILGRYLYSRRSNVPKVDDLIQPYAQSPADISNKMQHGFQNRPLPNPPTEQHIYGSSACMNNHGSDEAANNRNSVSCSDESVTSQSNLLQKVSANQNPQVTNSGKPQIKKASADTVSKKSLSSAKEGIPLLKHRHDSTDSSSMLAATTGPTKQPGYSTLACIDYVPQQTPTSHYLSDRSNSSLTNETLYEGWNKYYKFALGSNDENTNSSEVYDPSIISVSKTNTLPLRGYSSKICPDEDIIKPISSCVLIGHEEVTEFGPNFERNTPKMHNVEVERENNLTYISRCEIPPSHCPTSNAATLSLTPINSLPAVNFPECSNGEYLAHPKIHPRDFPQSNQPRNYSRLTETSPSCRDSGSCVPLLNFPPPPASSPPSPCPDDNSYSTNHLSLPYCYSSQPFSSKQCQFSPANSLESVSVSAAPIPIINSNGYTPFDGFFQNSIN